MSSDRELRVAPHIYRSWNGWRVYVRRDGTLKPNRLRYVPASSWLLPIEAWS